MQSVVSDLLLTNTIISLLLWDNEVASVLFPLPSDVLRKVVLLPPLMWPWTGPRGRGCSNVQRSPSVSWIREGLLGATASEKGCDSGERSALNDGSV